jgi:hypothetical protein
MWVVGLKARTSWANFQGQAEKTRPAWNVHFNKEKDGWVVRLNERLTRL